MAHTFLKYVALLAAFAALPACVSSEEKPSFGADEMKAVVVGTWTGTLTTGGKTSDMTLVLEYAAPGSTPACSNRTLGVDPECIDVTTMGLKGTVTTSDGVYKDAPLTGTFSVMGMDVSGGYLDLTFKDGRRLSAQQQQQSKAFGDCKLYDDYQEAGSCTMAR
jgi:hypothetical protein